MVLLPIEVISKTLYLKIEDSSVCGSDYGVGYYNPELSAARKVAAIT